MSKFECPECSGGFDQPHYYAEEDKKGCPWCGNLPEKSLDDVREITFR